MRPAFLQHPRAEGPHMNSKIPTPDQSCLEPAWMPAGFCASDRYRGSRVDAARALGMDE